MTKQQIRHKQIIPENNFRNEVLEYFISHFLPEPPLKVVDLGGTGRFTIILTKKGYNVLLYGVSSTAVDSTKRIARQQGVYLKYKIGSIIDLDSLESESFDAAISMNNAIGCCKNPALAFQEVCRILKHLGVFIGSVDNLFVCATATELKQGNLNLFIDSMNTGIRHIPCGKIGCGHKTHGFTTEELHSLLENAGFRYIQILGVFNLLGKNFDNSKVLKGLNKNLFFETQLQYAMRHEYINNSTDYFFVCQK